MAARACQSENLDREPMPRPHDAVPLSFEFDAIMRPMRSLQTPIGKAHQQVEKPKEGWLRKILHAARPVGHKATATSTGFDKVEGAGSMLLSPLVAMRQKSSAQRALGGGPIVRTFI